MASRIILLIGFVAVARAGVLAPAPLARVATPLLAQGPIISHAAPIAKTVTVDADYDPNPQYSYSYDIQDALTGDNKNHVESRSGDVVQGSYSLVDPDGTRRTVEYTADPINGFNAIVHREPLVKAVAAAPVAVAHAAPVAYAAPVAKFAAPLSYAAPVAKIAAPVAYAAPIAKYATSIAAPVSYAAPIAKYAAPLAAPVAYAAPVARYAAPLGYAAPVAPLGYAGPIAKTYIH